MRHVEDEVYFCFSSSCSLFSQPFLFFLLQIQATQRYTTLIAEDPSTLMEVQREAARLSHEYDREIALSYAAGQLWGVAAEIKTTDPSILAEWGTVRPDLVKVCLTFAFPFLGLMDICTCSS